MIIKWNELNKNSFAKFRNNSVAVINFASTEQHANHLPVGTDVFLGEAVLTEAASRAKSNVIVLPQVCYGYSPHHTFADGYITISQPTLIQYAKDIVKSIYNNQFKKIILVNSHGGNSTYLQAATNEIGEEYEDLSLAVLKYWDLISDVIAENRESETGGMGHAGEFETSVIMYLYPHLVNYDCIECCPPAKGNCYYKVDLVGGKKVYYRFIKFNKYNENGNIGQAHLATREKGELFFNAAAEKLAEFFDYFVEL